MEKFLPFIDGKSVLILYAVYSIVIMVLVGKKLKKNNGYFVASAIDEEKYYVMKYYYNVKHLFYYITYKLCNKGLVLKEDTDGRFCINKEVKVNLSNVEEQVYNMYRESFSPKDFNKNMIDENYFKDYYYSIYNKLLSEGFIRDHNIVSKNRLILILGIIIILIPGILKYFGGIANGMPTGILPSEIVVILVIYLVCLYPHLKGRLTNEGNASKEVYEKHHSAIVHDKNQDADGKNSDQMSDFLTTSFWMLFLGVSSIGTDRDKVYMDNSSGGYCSSCSNNSSSGGSSCSS